MSKSFSSGDRIVLVRPFHPRSMELRGICLGAKGEIHISRMGTVCVRWDDVPDMMTVNVNDVDWLIKPITEFIELVAPPALPEPPLDEADTKPLPGLAEKNPWIAFWRKVDEDLAARRVFYAAFGGSDAVRQ